ncbi:protein mono-ADP-ribosyltransferase PARP9 [Ornithorhynchus anatinus]|uniref:protein mono-ADP-ribosyltransferase PARP9 n=1 Tax=Ornithorhynchus anatinus TaxID=9258 RepID=UPI0010A8311F|nr:protein mono-ADP-ribosyltransferase PARP9 [Ornithorhynchus anatinus]
MSTFGLAPQGAAAAGTFSNSQPERAYLQVQENVDVPVSARDLAALDRSWDLLTDLFLSKFGCVLVATPAAEEATGLVYRATLPGAVELTVWRADLTRHAVDGVVNAANGRLRHVGGLAGALARAGGREVTEESEAWVRKHGPVPPGGFAVTGPGLLGCRLLLHAVGPVWTPADPDLCTRRLRSVVAEVLAYADRPENGLRSLALPAISSGIYGFPLDLCARVIVATVASFFVQGRKGGGGLREVHLVSNEDPTVAALRKEAEARLGSGLRRPTTPGRARGREHEAFRAEAQSSPRTPAGQRGQRGGGAVGPRLELAGPSVEVREAEAWLRRLLEALRNEGLDGQVVVEDPLLLCLGAAEHAALGQLQASVGVSLTEHVGDGRARLVVREAGGAAAGLLAATLDVERLLRDTRTEWIREKEAELWNLAGFRPPAPTEGDPVFLEEVEEPKQKIRDWKKQFEKAGLQILKVEKVLNGALEASFELRKDAACGRSGGQPDTEKLYQPVPWFARGLVARVGFQRLLTEPPEPQLGAGAYFVREPGRLVADGPWARAFGADPLLHVFEAEVLTGASGPGRESLTAAPAGCDSVTDGSGTFVVFGPARALPRYLLTCARTRARGPAPRRPHRPAP